jgi:hypothetical protein
MRINPWVLGSAAVVGVLLLATTAKAAALPSIFRRSEEDDLDALASMLITETRFAHSKAEMAQILNVAINRSRRWGFPIPKIVAGPPPGGGHSGWNNYSGYIDYFRYNARQHAKWPEARAFAAEVLGGAYPNVGAMSFIHPGGMPTPPCAANRVATSTVAGARCIPTWIAHKPFTVIGKGMFA